jgi:CW_7 repeat
MTTWEKASESLSKVDGATRKRAREIFDAAKAAGHDIWYMWGYDNDASNTEHHSGRALDLMVKNHEIGQWIRDYAWRNRERLDLQHVIWEQHITSTVTSPGVVRKMADRGNTTANHMDHVHVLFFDADYVAPGGGTPPPTTGGGTKSVTELAQEVLAGKWGNGDDRVNRLRAAGYNYDAVQVEVNRLVNPPTKSVSQLANEVIAQKWGNGSERVERLKAAGYDPVAVQAEVNRVLTPKGSTKPKLTIAQVATQVLRGEWGNGSERVERLTKAGYNAKAVQAEVNRRA